MPIGLYLSILKPFIIPLGFTATATICLLMILKNCLRGYLLCQQLSCQNFSFYFVLNLDTEPSIFNGSLAVDLFPAISSASENKLPAVSAVKWNFTKFLVDRSGKRVLRFSPTTDPASLEADIERFLASSVD